MRYVVRFVTHDPELADSKSNVACYEGCEDISVVDGRSIGAVSTTHLRPSNTTPHVVDYGVFLRDSVLRKIPDRLTRSQ